MEETKKKDDESTKNTGNSARGEKKTARKHGLTNAYTLIQTHARVHTLTYTR